MATIFAVLLGPMIGPAAIKCITAAARPPDLCHSAASSEIDAAAVIAA